MSNRRKEKGRGKKKTLTGVFVQAQAFYSAQKQNRGRGRVGGKRTDKEAISAGTQRRDVITRSAEREEEDA